MVTGFNLVARPDRQGASPVFLELNQTEEHLKFDPIVSSIPNKGFLQDDIELFGLPYLQKISDAVTGGALHIEPGIWIIQPPTTHPLQAVPEGKQIVARMGSIPHGNAILVRGVAERFAGPPTLRAGGVEYHGSVFPSFNSTPFPVGGPIFAATSAEFDLPPPPPPAPAGGFPEYRLINPAGDNSRTPFGNTPPVPLPASIDGVLMQDLVNDPIALLRATISKQIAEGFTFEGTDLNITSQTPVQFGTIG